MMVVEFYFVCFLFCFVFFFFTLGWPKLQWFVTANLNRHPKDWQPPSNLDRSSPAYIEVCGSLHYMYILHKLLVETFFQVLHDIILYLLMLFVGDAVGQWLWIEGACQSLARVISFALCSLAGQFLSPPRAAWFKVQLS